LRVLVEQFWASLLLEPRQPVEPMDVSKEASTDASQDKSATTEGGASGTSA
jgi:hypothetical protein